METKIRNFGRWCREKIINEMVSAFKGSPTLFVTEFSGLKVVNLETLRTKLRKNYSRLLVVKNSLASKAFKEMKLDFLSELFAGQAGLIIGGDDPAAVSKILFEFGKSFPSFQIKGGVFNGEPLTVKQIKDLSLLPPRNIMLAKVCSGIKSPLHRLVANLGLINRFVLSLKKIEFVKKGGN